MRRTVYLQGGLLALALCLGVASAEENVNTQVEPQSTATCTPTSEAVISNSGVKSALPSCFKNSITYSVSGHSNPWSQTENPTLIYSAPGDAYIPVYMRLTARNILPGAYVSVACTGGTTNAGGLPNTGCAGLDLPGYSPTNDTFQPACGTYYPSKYVDSSNYPIYVFQIIGAFVNSSGVVVGKPFALTTQPEIVAVPAGAVILQFGMNDCLNSDNSSAALTVKVLY